MRHFAIAAIAIALPRVAAAEDSPPKAQPAHVEVMAAKKKPRKLVVTRRYQHPPATAAASLPASTLASASASTPPSIAVRAVSPPPPPPAPGLTLPEYGLQLSLTMEASVSAGAAGSPISLAPDLAYGVTPDLTIALVHSSSALTGFRGSAGAGVCVTSSCNSMYADVGLEAIGSLVRGTLALAFEGGLLATSVEPWRSDLKLGVRSRLGGRVYAMLSPNLWLALDHRRDELAPHRDQLWVPLALGVKLTPAVATGAGTGVKGPLANLAHEWSVPLGVFAQVAVTPEITLGSSFVFGKIAAGDAIMGAGPDGRAVQVWIAVTRAPPAR